MEIARLYPHKKECVCCCSFGEVVAKWKKLVLCVSLNAMDLMQLV